MSATGGRFGHGRDGSHGCRTAPGRGRVVEQRLVEGELSCPDCGGVLARWGWGRPRRLRGPAGPVEVRPRRARCRSCEATRILLPVLSLVRRADVVEVVGAGLELAAVGWGCRRIAERLGRPVTTVRGWLRCWSGRAGRTAAVFTTWLVGWRTTRPRCCPLRQERRSLTRSAR
ncbi:helix-turn-helix domain-containing protein [Streptomyces sp. NPDC054775]